MKNLFFLALLFCFTTAQAQDSTETMRPKKVIKFEAHYNNGILKEKGKYKLHDFPAIKGGCTQGVPAFTGYAKFGKWTEYYENGNKKSITIYREGKYEKIKKLWEEDGTKIEVIPEEE